MITLEAILQDLKQVPPEHLEGIYQLVHSLTVRSANDADNAAAVERIMGAAGILSDWGDNEWNDFEAELKRARTQLFNRSLPNFDADAA